MGLPIHNPIDGGWCQKGSPIDHLGTIEFDCKACGKVTRHEKFLLLAGRYVGFGAPSFVKPFQKRASIRGKVGGTKGIVVQCVACDSLWAFDQTGQEAMEKLGYPREGIPSETHQADYLRNIARNESVSTDPVAQNPTSKARKLD